MEGLNGHFCHGFYPQVRPKSLLISLIGYRKVKKGGIIETEKPAQSMKTETAYTSSADELIKYKKLLDDGAITQDEYDVKKKELLNL